MKASIILMAVVMFALACGADPQSAPTPEPIIVVVTATPAPTVSPTLSLTPEHTATTAPEPTAITAPIANPTPTLTPILTPTPTPEPTATPTPEPTATPTPVPTPTPIPTPTLMPTPTFSQEDLADAEEERQLAGKLWFVMASACTDDEYRGRRKHSDIRTLLLSQEINDQMKADMATLPHHDEMTPEQKLEAARIFRRTALELEELCLPPGVELGGK